MAAESGSTKVLSEKDLEAAEGKYSSNPSRGVIYGICGSAVRKVASSRLLTIRAQRLPPNLPTDSPEEPNS